MTNGPFKLEGWTGSELSWKLVKNDGYWDAANVQLQTVTVNVSKEVATSVQLFDGKQVNTQQSANNSSINIKRNQRITLFQKQQWGT